MVTKRVFRRRYVAPGAPPGTFHVPADAVRPSLHAISFNAQELDEHQPDSADAAAALLRPDRVVWIDVQGLGDAALLAALGERFQLHPLAIADIANVGQRPKAEDYGDRLVCFVRMVTLTGPLELRWEQVGVVIGPGFVLTFQEQPGDCLQPLRDALRRGRPALRHAGADLLGCLVIDAIVDACFPVLEQFGEALETIEEQIIGQPDERVLSQLYVARRELLTFRRSAWPLRDTISSLLRDRPDALSPGVQHYLRDTADHLMQIVDIIETYRELTASLVDVYLSRLSHQTNEVMRVLTVIATIFIPLTFVAGIYGMNFDTAWPTNMPELRWRYGYVAFWAVCVATAGLLVWLFRRRGWIGARHRAARASPAGSI